MIFFSYIDPGSGNLIFQMLISGFLAMMYIFRKTFLALFQRLKRLFKKEEKN